MWTGFVTVALASSCALYAIQGGNDDEALALERSEEVLASGMALYRDAVVRYAHDNPAFQGKVPDAQLALPAWHAALDAGLWSNHVRADGLIMVYATRLPKVDIGASMAALAHGSELAGRANRSSGRIDPSARSGSGVVALPDIPSPGVPHGAPVWLAHRY